MAYNVRFASTPEELDAGYALRKAVFEVEQAVPRPLDRDAFDFNADHVVVFDDTCRCVGTGRAVRLDARTCQVGRMAVVKEVRRHGVGALVLEALERIATMRGLKEIVVHSQLPAEPFYRRQGYLRSGDVFQEQGVPHVLMRKIILQ